jgi:glycosyltransferase involved in cell wall biosynthesis
MPPLSIAIVCKNNQSTLPRVLASLQPFVTELNAEILALDSGSTDDTIPLLEKHNARILRQSWQGYVATKQAALDAAQGDWILSIDSDESPEPELARAIIAAVRATSQPHTSINGGTGVPPVPNNPAATPTQSGPAGYRINRMMWYQGRPLLHAWQPEWRLRLVRRGTARWGGIDPHDKLELLPTAGTHADLPRTAVLRHDSMETVAEFLARQVNHSRLFAQGLHAQGTRTTPLRVATSPAGAFLKQLLLKSAWRDGWRGWVAAAAHASAAAMKHAILLELQHNSNQHTKT